MTCIFCTLQTQDTYRLIVTASDLNGESGGNTGSGEVEIKILDINDNFPTLERESVSVTVCSYCSVKVRQ